MVWTERAAARLLAGTWRYASSSPFSQIGLEELGPAAAPGEVERLVMDRRVPEGREVDGQPACRGHPRAAVGLGDEGAPRAPALDGRAHGAAGLTDGARVGGPAKLHGEVVEVHIRVLEEVKRAAPGQMQRGGDMRPADVAQERPGEGVHRLDQVAELAEVDGGLGGVLGPVPVGLDVPLDDGG